MIIHKGRRTHVLDDRGMSTVEYAICTLAAAGLAVLLLALVTGDWMNGMLEGLLRKAFAAVG
ncbi:DUF4244 domain-containing protein [Actinosynnema sp. NPDC020468]|uniref:DUF4244 domain-containing protein n=1 Tax=Actinosynnema sp. NPDC020468 TaxID=3154488 RepID=UPI0033D80A52